VRELAERRSHRTCRQCLSRHDGGVTMMLFGAQQRWRASRDCWRAYTPFGHEGSAQITLLLGGGVPPQEALVPINVICADPPCPRGVHATLTKR
jgi:hypothetical protein